MLIDLVFLVVQFLPTSQLEPQYFNGKTKWQLPLVYIMRNGSQSAPLGAGFQSQIYFLQSGVAVGSFTWERRWEKTFSWLLPWTMTNAKQCTNKSLQIVLGKLLSNSVAGFEVSPTSSSGVWYCSRDSDGQEKANYKMPERKWGRGRGGGRGRI